MRATPKISLESGPEGASYRVLWVSRQRELVEEALSYFEEHDEPAGLAELQTGLSGAEIRGLRVRITGSDEVLVSLAELHGLHAALSHIPRRFAAEEPFHVRTAFYREQAIALADGFEKAWVKAVDPTRDDAGIRHLS